ncbi:response regulator [Nocardioides sp. MAHUQ-72]|uniref:response regulator n=1 Tax=unclassified Nocardioides TaxID=2615069 RepID=UPI003611EC49
MTVPTVLVVDDDDSVREITQLALEVVAGWRVVAADRGATALELARTLQPDAILLDVMMPEMDGPTTFRHLQADEATRDIPVILLTAKVLAGERQLWDELAIRGVIPKPFDPMTLPTEVSRMLGWEA